MQTLMKDDPVTLQREAWQNGECTYRWTRQEVDRMHREAPQTVHPWGAYPATKPGFPKLTPNNK